jgi:uncharacterized repeat protein (TIGR01451 family)
MKQKFYSLKTLLIPLLLLSGMAKGVYAQTLDLSKSVANITTGGNGSAASQNDILEYTITARNLTSANITASTLFDNIPAGVSYVAGSTTLNAVSVADASGNMPYAGAGGLINSPLYGPGILAPNAPATVTFRVRVTANGGSITNYGTLQGNHTTGNIIQNTNTVFTNLTADASCSVIYQSTASTQSGVPSTRPYRFIRSVNTANGTAGPLIYDGATGACFNAVTGAGLPAGSVLTYSSAIAYDKNSNRIYFVNNSSTSAQDLCYVDLNTTPVSAKRFVGYPLEPTTGTGTAINRMAFASDGYGYAITTSGSNIIRFSIDPGTGLPVISQLGALINDATNGSNDILSEGGGDIFGDGSGNLYLIANSSKMYKINPNTRIATFMGSITPFPGTSNSIAIDASGTVYIGGAYQNVYTVNLATMNASSITGGSTTNVWTNGDYTSCGFPVLAPALTVNKTYANINGSPFILGGDTVEYTIEVTNTGNINAAGVKLYDSIPGSTNYIASSTTLNNTLVPDVSGTMPFAVAGGQFVNSPGEQSGIIKPGAANKAIVKFRAKTSPLHLICNQGRITLLDMNGNTIFVNSDDPSQSGSQNSTCFYSDGVLPVHNVDLKGYLHNNQAVLQWQVTGEQNVQYYEVEYAPNGVSFTSLGKVMANGNGGATSSYQFTDMANRPAGARYYRVKAVQMGGSYFYSRIILFNAGNLRIQVQPNPFDRDINVQLPLTNAETIRLRLIDMHGREVYGATEKLNAGTHVIHISTPAGAGAGMYVLEIVAGNKQVYHQKLLKR